VLFLLPALSALHSSTGRPLTSYFWRPHPSPRPWQNTFCFHSWKPNTQQRMEDFQRLLTSVCSFFCYHRCICCHLYCTEITRLSPSSGCRYTKKFPSMLTTQEIRLKVHKAQEMKATSFLQPWKSPKLQRETTPAFPMVQPSPGRTQGFNLVLNYAYFL